MKRLSLSCLLFGLLVFGCGGGEAAAGKKRLAFVTNGVAAFWLIAEKGAQDAGEACGADVSVWMPAEGIGDQKRMLEDLVTRQVEGIAVSPIDPTNQTELLNQIAARTNLITHDSDAPDSKRLCYVGMDNYRAGRRCGELVKEALPEGGSVFLFVGRLEQDNGRLRRQGLIDELLDRPRDPARHDPHGAPIRGEKYTVLGTLTDQYDRAVGKANAEDALSKHPDLGCMVGLFAYNPPLCLAALEQAGKVGEVALVAFDEDDDTLRGIREGAIFGTIVQDPYSYGYKSIEILDALAKGDRSVLPASGVVDIPVRKITQDTVDAFWADLKKKTGED